jgi:hypothetical protein
MPRVTVVGYHEMGSRSLAKLLSPYPNWQTVQGPRGDRGRSPIAFDMRKWHLNKTIPAYPDGWFVRQLSWAKGHGPVSVSSGNRYATVAILNDDATNVPVAFIGYHSVAHMNVGAHFGYTGHGPRDLLALREQGIPNPAIGCYQQGMRHLESLIRELKSHGLRVVPLGDWNFDAFADLKAKGKGTAELYGPHRTMDRAGVETVYSGGHLTHGTDGKRGIDYLGMSHGQPGTAKILGSWTVSGAPSDHAIAVMRARVTDAAGKVNEFDVATANIRATPAMPPRNVEKCIYHTVRLDHP